MAAIVPSSSVADIISEFNSAGLSNLANAAFFGQGSLTGTIEATNLDFNPLEAPTLSPGDFPNLNTGQLALMQEQLDLQTLQINNQQRDILASFDQQRRERLAQNADTLAATQLLFGTANAIDPTRSGSNAAALTGVQAGVRRDLTDLSTAARSELGNLAFQGRQNLNETLGATVDADLTREQNFFERGVTLSDQFGFRTDSFGNPILDGNNQPIPTLEAIGQQATIDNQLRDDDRAERSLMFDQTGIVVNQKGEYGYRTEDGLITFDKSQAATLYVTDSGRKFSTEAEAVATGEGYKSVPQLYIDPAVLAQTAELSGLNQEVNTILQQEGGNGQFVLDEDGEWEFDLTKAKTFGLDIREAQTTDSLEGTATPGTDKIREFVSDRDVYRANADIFNQVFFNTAEGGSAVAMAAGDFQNNAGYDIFTVNNLPEGQSDIPLPQDLIDSVNAVVPQGGETLPAGTGLFDLLTNYGLNSGADGRLKLSNNDIGVVMNRLYEWAETSDQVTKSHGAQDIVSSFNGMATSDELKRLTLQGMLMRQVEGADLFKEDIFYESYVKLANDMGKLIENSEGKKYDEIRDELNSADTLDDKQSILNDFVVANTGGEGAENVTPASDILRELKEYKQDIYTNYMKDIPFDSQEQRQALAGEYFVATTALLLGDVNGGADQIENATFLLEFLETEEETQSRKEELSKSPEDADGGRVWYKPWTWSR